MIRLLILSLVFSSLAICDYSGYLLFQTVPSKAGTATTAPYSLLISGTFPALASTASGGHVSHTVTCGVNAITCPADLVFARDSACGTPMAGWEIQSWSPSSGQLTATVEIPILSNTRASKVYACVGNPAITTFQGGTPGTAWDSGYQLAFHMDETSGTILHDFSANGNNALKKGASSPLPVISGQVGSAQRFTGTANSTNNDYALFESPTTAVRTYTIEYWSNAISYVNQDAVFLESHGAPAIYTAFNWYPAGIAFYKNSYNGATPFAPALASTGTFHNVVYVRDGSTMSLYLDGVAGTSSSDFDRGDEVWLGLGWDGGANPSFNSFNGTLDEVFYSSVARSASYVTARYNNLNSPSTFYTVGSFTAIVPPARSTTAADSQVNIF